jgi:hypothetical protein
MTTYTEKIQMQQDSLEWLKNKFILNEDYKIYFNSHGYGKYQVFMLNNGLITNITATVAKCLLLKYNSKGYCVWVGGSIYDASTMTEELNSLLKLNLLLFHV